MKFILISILVFFIFYKLLGFFFRLLLRGSVANQQRYENTNHQQRKKPSDGNVNIDYIPKENGKEKTPKEFKGGDYIDYEEVK